MCSIGRIRPSWMRSGCKKTLCLLNYPRKIKFIHAFILSLSLSASLSLSLSLSHTHCDCYIAPHYTTSLCTNTSEKTLLHDWQSAVINLVAVCLISVTFYCLKCSVDSNLLVDHDALSSFRHHYSGMVCPTLSDTLLPLCHLNLQNSFLFRTLNAFPVCVQLCTIGFMCVSVCVC